MDNDYLYDAIRNLSSKIGELTIEQQRVRGSNEEIRLNAREIVRTLSVLGSTINKNTETIKRVNIELVYFQYVDRMNSLELSFLKNEIKQEDYVRMLKSYSKAYAQIGGSKVANLQLAKNLECLPEELEKFKKEITSKKNAEGMGEN